MSLSEARFHDLVDATQQTLEDIFDDSDLDIDLSTAAGVIGVDRVICLVTQVGDQVSVVRDYDGLEVTLLEATKIQFGRFVEILDGAGVGGHRSLH